jgi:heparin binding hemagglutinin HbhA
MTITNTINAQVKSLVEDVKALPGTLKKVDVADLRSQAQGLAKSALGQATGVYADLSKKGEGFVTKAKGFKVDDIKKTAEGAQKKAEVVAEDVQKKAESFVADASKKAEEFVAEAKATVTKVTSKAPAAKPAAKKPAAKPAAKKPAAKPAAKKAPVAKPVVKSTPADVKTAPVADTTAPADKA